MCSSSGRGCLVHVPPVFSGPNLCERGEGGAVQNAPFGEPKPVGGGGWYIRFPFWEPELVEGSTVPKHVSSRERNETTLTTFPCASRTLLNRGMYVTKTRGAPCNCRKPPSLPMSNWWNQSILTPLVHSLTMLSTTLAIGMQTYPAGQDKSLVPQVLCVMIISFSAYMISISSTSDVHCQSWAHILHFLLFISPWIMR